MSEIGGAAPAAPAAAPSAPSAPTSAPSGPDPRGAPPRGHKWGPPPATPAAKPAGQVPVPAQARTAQQVSTGEPPKAAAKPTAPTPPKLDASKPETATQREARIIKHRLASGEEIDVDIAEHLERAMATEKRKVKVNGQEREITIAEALERFPLAEGSHQRFREAHEQSEKAKATIERVKQELSVLKDPKRVPALLSQILGAQGVQQMMEEHLSAIYEREKMPEDKRRALEEHEAQQRGIETEREKLARERSEFEAQRNAEATQRFEAAKTAEITRLQRDYPILLKEAGLPVTPKTMARLAQAAMEARELKIPYTERQLAAHVAQEIREELGHFSESADPETLRGMLGKGADKIRQADVDRVMKQPGRGVARVGKPSAIPDTIKTPEQLRKHLRAQDLAAERRGR